MKALAAPVRAAFEFAVDIGDWLFLPFALKSNDCLELVMDAPFGWVDACPSHRHLPCKRSELSETGLHYYCVSCSQQSSPAALA